MRITVGKLRRIVREVASAMPKMKCRACGGEGSVVGEYCAACAGEGTELAYAPTDEPTGVGRPTVPYTK